MTPIGNFTEPTTGYWQELLPDVRAEERQPPYRFAYPVQLPDGQWLKLPIRQRAEPTHRAVASFIANHASFPVLDALAGHMANQVRGLRPDIIVGLPTLGLALAPPLARALGHSRFVPLGTSRKYWYDEHLSAETTSITTSVSRRLYVDPNLLPLLRGKRVLIVDDTISSGTTAAAAVDILMKAEAEIVGLAFAMSQGDNWRAFLTKRHPHVATAVSYVFQTPHFALSPDQDGWEPLS